MPLTNAEKQARHRQRVAKKLKDLKAIEEGLHGKDADVVEWLKRSIDLCHALEFPKRSHICRKVEKADKMLLIGIDLALWKRLKVMAAEREVFLKDLVIEILRGAAND